MSAGARIDVAEARSRLGALEGREYWRSLEELLDTEDFREHLHREFRVPIESGFNRRELLTLMGASIALAGLTGCTRQPTEKIYPYVQAPEELIPGVPLYYATAHLHGGYARGVLAKSYEGRPIKIEGNELHPASLGGTDVFAQGYILNMYDPDRSQTLTERGEIRAWSSFLAAARLALEKERPGKGAGLRFLTRTVTSPTLQKQLAEVLAAFPAAQWVSWEPVNRDAILAGAQLAFGEAVEVKPAFDRADVILSLEADFLGSGPSMPRAVRDFAARRRGEGSNRLYVVEATPSLTGARADHRRPMKPAEIEAFARAVAVAVGAIAGASRTDPFVEAVAADLKAHRGSSLVVAGETQPPSVHALAHAMNEALGNVGKTVAYVAPAAAAPADQTAALRALVADMNAGKVTTLVIVDGNPVYDAPADLEFARALEKVGLRIHLSLYDDETSRHCHWHVAAAHPLETWSDARAEDGTVTILQPLIAPLFSGKSAHELLAAFSDQPERTGHDIVKDSWRGRLPGSDFDAAWRKALHDGLVDGSAAPAKAVRLRADLGSEIPAPTPAGEGLTLVFRADPTVWDGAYANNGWMQELSKPLTKLTWDNAALIAPATAQRLGVTTEDVVTLTAGGRKVSAAVWVMPGQAEDCVTVHLGYGRTRGGRVASGRGFDAYALRASNALWTAPGLEVVKTLGRYPLATTQHQYSMEGRDPVRATTAAAYASDPGVVAKMGEKPPGPDDTLYPKMPAGAYAWGLSIDLSTCVGCNACIVACQSENNIPIVGKEQVAIGRALQWIRVDRYYKGSLDAPETVHQPVTCMHCENAPCEVVCPVNATVHSAEGLNQMVYNRCVGTRYCSNNCPYKVRRFNFFLYTDYTTEILKLARNPDVTVRSRGVMEKCSYCVQRINRARYEAEKENRPIRDGEIVTACQQACPAQAIVFGNVADPESRVSKAKAEQRSYGLLTELGTRPRTTYLASLSNPNPTLAGAGPAAGGGEKTNG
ncbi:MAG TPA: TAT-variant-translocated molybdopterin oxidoreductase [Thermoanaerobaculia bacterium]|nr:TAT-variant-translocated molybdopterin oxidoreductase [Thermoanaerobaculia bacterium]